ncbi:YqaE/Pmp3 family membrane protein, partial [Treponema sp.]|uniref:YqaE/Pmp3 family membrane protein n=1 Tax=Treponema sp. TaxID=166 RepID=UPI00298E9BC8
YSPFLHLRGCPDFWGQFILLCIIFPPLAVLDKGCGSLLIVLLLTCCGWVPGVIAALVILNKSR